VRRESNHGKGLLLSSVATGVATPANSAELARSPWRMGTYRCFDFSSKLSLTCSQRNLCFAILQV